MTGYEQQLYERAEVLDETGELTAAVTAILAGASGAGVDPRAITGLQDAVRALDPAGGAPGYQAGSQADRHAGAGTPRTPNSWRHCLTPRKRSSAAAPTCTGSSRPGGSRARGHQRGHHGRCLAVRRAGSGGGGIGSPRGGAGVRELHLGGQPPARACGVHLVDPAGHVDRALERAVRAWKRCGGPAGSLADLGSSCDKTHQAANEKLSVIAVR